MPSSVVTLITDFGTRDGYVAEMKGVMLGLCPGACIVDVTHDIEPGDIRGGAWVLARIWKRFAPGTIHVAVVDPGVGGDRRPIAARTQGRWYVGPDNGLLTRVSGVPEEARIIGSGAPGVSAGGATFHGRDVFAPAAAWLAGGGEPARLGPTLDGHALVRFDCPRPERRGDRVTGRVQHVDRFGNLITDIPAAWVDATCAIEIAGLVIGGVSSHYAAVDRGEIVAVIGSGATLEIAVRDGSAAERLGARDGAAVSVRCSGG